jgi:magnesium chelatase family protein
MPSKVYSAAIVGLDAQIIEVEAEVSFGLRHFEIVGLPDKAVEESQERISAAIKSSGLKSPGHQPWRTLVNLAPADLKKEGSFYDLPIAMAFLVASNQLSFNPEEKIFVGELALDGRLRPVKGILSFVLLAKNRGIQEIILPKENIPEASLIFLLEQKGPLSTKNLDFYKPKLIGLENLKEVVAYLENRKEVSYPQIKIEDYIQEPDYPVDLGWIKGQEYAKRALEISAAGSHHLLMQGPPGAGNSLLAKAIPSILPPLSPEEILEITKIYSVAGLLPKEKPLINFRPFRSPHHSVSEVAV